MSAVALTFAFSTETARIVFSAQVVAQGPV
jgi:hypothetical protein